MKSGSNRNYNVFFNTHTVSGIVISIGLFICFFAGAFALFLDNINYWEANKKRTAYATDVDYERVLSVVEDEGYHLGGRNILVRYRNELKPYIQVRSQALKVEKDSLSNTHTSEMDAIAMGPIFIKIDPDNYQITAKEFKAGTHHLGTFFYHLHYFQPIIPVYGIYIAGLVSLFFLFAILTGVIVHWKKIWTNFFTFRLKATIKNLWTDAHTALGVIGLPFQFMYAVTGAFYGLSILILLPSVMILFDGDRDKLIGYVAPAFKTYEKHNKHLEHRANINELVNKTKEKAGDEGFESVSVNISNYQDQNAHLTVNIGIDAEKQFYRNAHTIYRLSDGEIVAEKKLGENTYQDNVLTTMGKLHFASYGGYFIRAVYFILALITCFVILSGVMIWLTAREKKMYEHRKKFNRNVGAIYLGASLGMYPAFALFFCMTKTFPVDMADRFSTMTTIFFGFWLGCIAYAFMIKNAFKVNKHAMILAGIMGLLIPILNGLQSGLWFWKSLPNGYIDSFFIDVAWLVMGTVTLLSANKFKPVTKVKQSVESGKVNVDQGQLSHEESTKEPILVTNQSNRLKFPLS